MLVPVGVLLHCWISIFKNIPARQVYMNLGSQFMRTGAGVKVGDPVKLPRGKSGETRNAFVKNIYYNFGKNIVTATYTDKPHLIKKPKQTKFQKLDEGSR